jgi:predicted MFS family arabinose efflux permease
MLVSLKNRFANSSRDIRLFLLVTLIGGFSGAAFDAVFNNYLNDTFSLSNLSRTTLELPRELPGLLIVFVSALLFFWCSRRLAAFSMALNGVGLALMAFFSANFQTMLVWLFVLSVGQHLFIPLTSSIGMELAHDGREGKRLGQFSSARNIAAIIGSFCIFLGFKYLHMSYQISFTIAAAGFGTSSLLLLSMTRLQPAPSKLHLRMHREYRLYYWLSILYGTRKQIFLTFAPWVLVTAYRQPATSIATLLTIGGILGIVTQPLIGKAIDKLGEKSVLASEAAILIVVCSGYGFSKALFPPDIALLVTSGCYVADQLLMSAGMARATYLKKIALQPDHVTPTLTMAVSIDHVFSIITAIGCGLVWNRWGYPPVFVLAAGIAAVNLISALRVRVPGRRSLARDRTEVPQTLVESKAPV